MEADPSEPSYADLTIGPSFPPDYVVFGDPATLPPPPELAEEELFERCEPWDGWLTENSGVLASPDFDIMVVGGKNDLVVISEIRSVLIGKDPVAAPPSIIRCSYGGGVEPGIEIHLNTAEQSTILTDLESGESSEMPPATVSLSEAGAFGASIMVASEPGFVYSGYFEITCAVNGENRVITYGSSADPIKWLGGDNFASSQAVYGWNHITRSWVFGLDPEYLFQ
ncbi:hypothetical protein [Jiangella anatolica]|uniref:hypothetical protein n=1 Tax=Jiangella anatolica TaxID=2670374 RepID=UPI0011B421C3|nr:hypothetical protein [Jiangella anatolica]